MWQKLLDPLYRWLTDYMGRAGLILYGGGSNKTPPPDPGILDAQRESLRIQNELARNMMANANALHPIQVAQMEFGLEAARTAYADSRVDRAYSLDRRGHLTGLQDSMIAEAEEYDSPAKQEEYAARGVADVETMVAGSEASAARDLARRGVNPASGAALAQGNASSLAKAGLKVSAANTGRTLAREEGRALKDRAANVLSGYPAMSMAATQNSAGNGMLGLSAANQAVGGIQGGFGAASAASAGASSTASGLYGQQLNAYQNAMNNQTAANNANTQAWGTAIGTAAAYMLSDRRIKVNIVKVADDPRGFGWYTFDYLGGAQGQFGVMAQEVAPIIPAAVTTKHGVLAVNYSML